MISLAIINLVRSKGLEQIKSSVPSSCGSLKINTAIIAENIAASIIATLITIFESSTQGVIAGILASSGTIIQNAARIKA